VLRLVRSLGASAVTVLGNHDLHLLAVATGARSRADDDHSLDPVLKASDRDELLDWLRRLPLMHEDPGLGFTLIHAGLAPQWDLDTARRCAREVETSLGAADYAKLLAQMYGNQPDAWSENLDGIARRRFTINCFTRLRYCLSDGRLALSHKGPLSIAPAGVLPWFRAPGRRSRGQRLIFGHWSALRQVFWPEEQVYCLDSGCLWGGSLSALRLTPHEVLDADLTSLPCRGYQSIG
jgi:bis(5'-nucleosyl)-tetraphosphatase (symmetrical)